MNAVIFDMDGVLVDSEPIHKEADVETFRTAGLDVPVRALQEYAGVGGDRFFSEVLARFGGRGDPAALRAVKNRILAGRLRSACPPVPGSRALLDRVASLGWRCALASSSDPQIVGLVLAALGIRERFDAVVTGADVARGKPAPDIFLHAARLVGLPPARCVVVEDSAAGTRAARAAGMGCVGLRNPLSGAQDLSAAHRVVESLDAVTAELLVSLLPPRA